MHYLFMSFSVGEGNTRAVELFVEARETRTGVATPGVGAHAIRTTRVL